jgi:tRNA U55 pseudouridine synthase TruB
LVKTVKERIAKVKGDFRQEKILDSWKNLLNTNSNASKKFQIIQLCIKSSSGAYMRTLAQKLGESLGMDALAWKIKRTKIGDYALDK